MSKGGTNPPWDGKDRPPPPQGSGSNIKMKAARIRITVEELAKLIGLPPEARIISAFQTVDDLGHGTVSFVIHGAGKETLEGSAIYSMSVDDLTEAATSSPIQV
jgi:hypothetical protein